MQSRRVKWSVLHDELSKWIWISENFKFSCCSEFDVAFRPLVVLQAEKSKKRKHEMLEENATSGKWKCEKREGTREKTVKMRKKNCARVNQESRKVVENAKITCLICKYYVNPDLSTRLSDIYEVPCQWVKISFHPLKYSTLKTSEFSKRFDLDICSWLTTQIVECGRILNKKWFNLILIFTTSIFHSITFPLISEEKMNLFSDIEQQPWPKCRTSKFDEFSESSISFWHGVDVEKIFCNNSEYELFLA